MPLDHKQALIGLLGLANTATDEEIALANSTFQDDMVAYKRQMDTLTNSAKQEVTAAKSEVATVRNELAAVNNRNTELLTELANRDIVAFKDVITDEAAIRTALVNRRTETVALLNGLKAKPAAPAAPKEEPIHNSKTAGQPKDTNGAATNAEAASKWVSNRAKEMRAAIPGLSFRESFVRAQSEIPAQFAA